MIVSLQEFVTLILYNMFDEDVDDLPCWQTVNLERCFVNILTSWHTHMVSFRKYIIDYQVYALVSIYKGNKVPQWRYANLLVMQQKPKSHPPLSALDPNTQKEENFHWVLIFAISLIAN